MSFDPIFFLMQREGLITRPCICTAFNELLGAGVSQKGRYYIAFFQLAIGIERAEKLVIILDHMIKNELAPPGEKATRKHKHDLLLLHDNAKAVAGSRSITKSISFELKPLHRRMLQFLTEFANGARYANLDALASGKSTKEPLVEWNGIMDDIFKEDLSEAEKASIIQAAAAQTSLMTGRAVVLAHDLTNNSLSVESMIQQELFMKATAPYVLWNLVILVLPITELVSQLAVEARRISAKRGTVNMIIPHMDEFYDFLYLDQEYVISRESWT